MSEEKPNDKKKQPEIIRESYVTYDDYANMPDDGNRYEIADGRLELMSGPGGLHQVISKTLSDTITQTCSQDYIILTAPFDVILSQIEVRQPDLIIVHRSRKSIITRRGIEGSPDVVVEILSPSTRRRDKLDKIKSYAKYEVPEYWIVDPDSYSLELYLLRENGVYELADLFNADEPVISPRLTCLSFTMNDIIAVVKDTLDWA
ncbi:Uma2 family endonuclease [Cohnella silvisoli]|uniref:Uma2 family endonuclease n=1 Tax=Cohnella silvisoli TaxID=2873699 RepID=A0ABV1L456_9BACL|nr:Uma2 family endonuclease [Cohnella silvisoli]MCD9026328.1 Uma2 family endonuclease [Cohnella silvisoli]